MAPIAKTYTGILSMYGSLFYNPSKRYITAADETNYMNMAITMLAKDIGGIRTVDTSTVSVASQRAYTLNRSHKRILEAEYIRNFNSSNESIVRLDIVNERDANFIRAASVAGTSYDNNSISLTGTTQDKPKYILPFYESGAYWLMDTPNTAGDTIRLFCLSMPTVMSTGVSYDGDESEVPAIAYKMAELSHVKMKDMAYASDMQSKYNEQVIQLRGMNFKSRRPKQLGDGRFEFTRLRSVEGSK